VLQAGRPVDSSLTGWCFAALNRILCSEMIAFSRVRQELRLGTQSGRAWQFGKYATGLKAVRVVRADYISRHKGSIESEIRPSATTD
jgi:hypothetical protein